MSKDEPDNLSQGLQQNKAADPVDAAAQQEKPRSAQYLKSVAQLWIDLQNRYELKMAESAPAEKS